jgi:hypothetical protein
LSSRRAAAQSCGRQRPLRAAEPAKPLGDRVERPVLGVRKIARNGRCPVEGFVHDVPAIDHEPDAARRGALGQKPVHLRCVRLRCERIDGGVDAGRLPLAAASATE